MLKEIKLTNLEFNKYFDFGSEGTIYSVKYCNKEYLYKKLKNNNIQNKINKLKELDKIKLPSDIHITKATHLIYSKEYTGYLMEKYDNVILDYLMNISLDKKIDILKNLKKTIVFLNNEGIIHGDIKLNNVIYDGKNPILCDMDNIMINNYLYDLKTILMKNYEKTCGKVDKNIDLFGFNLLTFCFINKVEYYNNYEAVIKENISTKDFKNFKNDESKKIIKNLIKFNNTYLDKYLIDEI